jgi:hypothetical protein
MNFKTKKGIFKKRCFVSEVKIVITAIMILSISQIQGVSAIAAFSEGPAIKQNADIQLDSIRTASMDDPTTLRYLETDFKAKITPIEEVQMMNASILHEIEPTNQVPPFIAANSIPESMNVSQQAIVEPEKEPAPLTSGYFSGHTWGSEFGPHDRDTRAVPVTPAMEGHWFPQSTYARISYQAYIQSNMKAHIRVERDQDTYSRYFRVYVGYVQILNTIIYSSQSAWEGDVSLIYNGWLTITLEIYSGGLSDKGWQLRYYHLFDSSGQPYDTTEENFQNALYSELRYRTPMGPSTTLDIECVNVHDPFYRYLYVYVDGQLYITLTAPGAFHINLPTYSTPGMHEIKFVLYFGNYGTNPKALTHWWVNYEYRKVEVDWMAGVYGGINYNHQQPDSVFDYLEAYWIIHDYRRVTFVESSSVLFDYDITWDQYKSSYRNIYFNHNGQTRWVYGLFAHYLYPGQYWGFGGLGYGFVIGDEASYYLLDYRKWILMHEYGHVEGMEDGSGGVPDIYGTNRILSYHYYHCSSWDQYLTYARGYW